MGKKDVALEVLAKVSGRDKDSFLPEQELIADLGIDSPKGLQMLAELEDRLQIEISEDDAAAMNTVGDILDYAGRLE